MLKKLVQVLKMLMLFKGGKSCEYINCIILQLHLLDYNKNINSPTWQMFKNQFSVFNEESGEVSFSVLARTVLGHSMKSEVEHMSARYRQINRVREIDDAIMADGGAVFKSDNNWRKKYTKESDMVITVGEFMKSRIRDIAGGGATMYDGTTDGYQSKANAGSHQLPLAKQSAFWTNNLDQHWGTHVNFIKQWTNSCFGAEVVRVWPEMDQHMVLGDDHPDAPAEEEAGEESGEEGDEDNTPQHPDECSVPGEQDEANIRFYPRGTEGVAHEAPPGCFDEEEEEGDENSDASEVPQQDQEVEEIDDPRANQSWEQQGRVHSGLILPEGARRKRARTVNEGPMGFMVEPRGKDMVEE